MNNSDELALNKAQLVVREAEASKARILNVKGKNKDLYYFSCSEATNLNSSNITRKILNKEKHHPSLVDENYLIVGNCIEDHIRQRIENGVYVDFMHLLPRDRLAIEEENRMEIVNKNERTYFMPVQDVYDSGNGITNFSRREQGFRVFSNIYCKKFPDRSLELIQYNHVIHTAAPDLHWGQCLSV